MKIKYGIMKEIWKDVLGYESLYQVSSNGIVKGLYKVVARIDGKVQTFNEKILKPSIGSSGYLCIALSKFNISKTFRVHQLVAIAFHNHIPCGHKLVVNHINNNKIDNRAVNLEIITQRENTSKDRHRQTYSSKYLGVSLNKKLNKWHSSIMMGDKNIHLGYFTNEIDASNAYQDKLKQIEG